MMRISLTSVMIMMTIATMMRMLMAMPRIMLTRSEISRAADRGPS